MGSIQQLSLVSRQVKGQAACHTSTGSPLGKRSQSISAQEIIILISNLPPFPLPILPASIIIRQLHIKNVISDYQQERKNKLYQTHPQCLNTFQYSYSNHFFNI